VYKWLCNNLSHSPLGISLGMVLLDHMADLWLIFKETSILFSKMVVLAYIPTSYVWEFIFVCILTNICFWWCSWWWLFSQEWGEILMWFWLAFPLCHGWWAVFQHFKTTMGIHWKIADNAWELISRVFD
jgi:hypothetical protein